MAYLEAEAEKIPLDVACYLERLWRVSPAVLVRGVADFYKRFDGDGDVGEREPFIEQTLTAVRPSAESGALWDASVGVRSLVIQPLKSAGRGTRPP
jgi:hypothetical protein